MEQLAGCDLARLMRTHGRGTTRQVATLVRQGCAALGAAHRAGRGPPRHQASRTHPGERPGGFLVKILDFGVAKSMAFEEGLTQTGVVVGTPTYMSPEQVRGEDVDTRSDVYSFATVCYEALTGTRAIPGGDLGRILINVIDTVPEAASRLVPGLPPEVDAAFESAMAKDRDRRLRDIEQWGAAFWTCWRRSPQTRPRSVRFDRPAGARWPCGRAEFGHHPRLDGGVGRPDRRPVC